MNDILPVLLVHAYPRFVAFRITLGCFTLNLSWTCLFFFLSPLPSPLSELHNVKILLLPHEALLIPYPSNFLLLNERPLISY